VQFTAQNLQPVLPACTKGHTPAKTSVSSQSSRFVTVQDVQMADSIVL